MWWMQVAKHEIRTAIGLQNQEVYNNLKRIGKIELPEFEPILGSAKQFFYRNKMEFGFSSSRWMTDAEIQSGEDFDNKTLLGFTFHACGIKF